MYFFPTSRIVRAGIDVSTILVYKNEPFIVTFEDGKSLLKVDLNEKDGNSTQQISPEDARNLPALRDLLVGSVEVNWKM